MISERKPIIWQDFYQELHENERNYTAGRTPSALFDSQMGYFFSELSHVTNLHEAPIKMMISLNLINESVDL